MAKEYMKSNLWLYVVIAVLVLVILGYLGISWYKNQIAKAQVEGYNVGVTNSVVSMIQQSRDCQPLSLFIGNQTFQFVDTACLQTAAK